MTALMLKCLTRPARARNAAWRLPLGCFLLACLALPSHAWANPFVKTVTGGPSVLNPRFYGYADGITFTVAQFNGPSGLALDRSGTMLFVADCTNNAVRAISNPGNENSSITSTFAGATNGISRPVAVAVDGATNVYVLNRGNGANGSVLQFNGAYYSRYGFAFFTATMASGLANATAMAVDGLTNLYVTVSGNTVIRIAPDHTVSVVGVLNTAGVSLRGITVLDNGLLALTDAGNHGVWLLNPADGSASALSGFHGAGDASGPAAIAAFNRPEMIAKAGNGMLVVTDRGNHKVKLVDPAGNVVRLYGVSSNLWVKGSASQGIFPGWYDGEVCSIDALGCPEAREPLGVVVAPDGTVYTTEVYYHLIRHTTATGLAAPQPGFPPLFANPMGIALDGTFTHLYIADSANNAVQVLDLLANQTTTFLTADNGLVVPVDVALDSADNLYVLNQGTGANGSILQFDHFGNLLASKAAGLALPTAFTFDGSGNFYVAQQGGLIQRFSSGSPKTITTINNAPGVNPQGIALFDDGTIAVSDAANHVIWQVDPASGATTLLSGSPGVPGSNLGPAAFARLNQPGHLARAGGNLLVAADSGNNRLVVLNRSGAVTNALSCTNSLVWFGRPGDAVQFGDSGFVPMVSPVGVVVSAGGAVFASETGYDNIRKLVTTGLQNPGPVGSGSDPSTGTNIVILPPTIDACSISGYYPMGRLVKISSLASNVVFTADGSEPTLNSRAVRMDGSVGYVPWFNSTNDLTGLRVRAYNGTNASAVTTGQPVGTNSIGIPAPGVEGVIPAGIGSTIVVPVVVNLQPNTQIKTYQFRVEIAPNGAAPLPSTAGFQTLPVSGNDFVPLTTAAEGNKALNLSGVSYLNGPAAGLYVSTANNGNYLFQRFAVVALLAFSVPQNAAVGHTYSIMVTNPSATADGLTGVNLNPMLPVTILVTNSPYTIGDSASASGAWYNAAGFGDGDLDNADVNNAFYAAIGQRVPFAFSDAFNAMDAYPPDDVGFVGGDGQVRYLDWQVILQRSLRLDPSNWARTWTVGGVLSNYTTALARRPLFKVPSSYITGQWPWLRQALISAVPASGATPGSTVNVPVFVKVADSATVSGLQFRVVITPTAGAPSLTQAPQFTLASGLPAPFLQQSLVPGEMGFGWSLGSFKFASRSSNLLGYVTFTLPSNALSGQGYTVSFTNADAAPDIYTQYDVETRSAIVAINAQAPAASASSDDWKLHFFGSLAALDAADTADPDHDGVPNWMEYLAGTDPTDPSSNLRFSGAEKVLINGQPQAVLHWLTAPGKAYEVQWSSTPAGGAWNILGTVSGDGSVANCIDNNAVGSARYYRLRILP